jgi:flagellar FliL protein
MLKKLLPVLLALVGTGAGVAAGLVMLPSASGVAGGQPLPDCLPNDFSAGPAPERPPDSASPTADREYVKMNNQFVIPVMGPDRVQALVVASLSVEVTAGSTESVYDREPKLRDAFLQVMFDHANIGGFEGSFTAADRMDILRGALLDAARAVLGRDVSDVLITEIARQDT